MTKEEIIDKIVDIAQQSAFDGLSTIYAEREATELAQKIVKNINYDTVLCPVDDIAKELGWQDYAHMMLNEDNIEGYAKKAIDMLYEQNGHKKPFYGA